MGLKNSYDSTIKDLKATFFDLFCEHTEELTGMIETLATDSNVDVMKLETFIFQRIIMLNKTAGNIKSLMTNVDELTSMKGIGLNVPKKNVAGSVNTPPLSVTSAPKVGVVNSQVSTNVSAQPSIMAPVAVPTTAPVQVATTAPQQVVTSTAPTVDAKPEPVTVPPTTAAPVVQATIAPTVAPVAATPRKSLTQTLTEKANNLPPRENKKYRFIKTSNNKVKAILVNDKQFRKLKASCALQAKLLDFGISTGLAPTKEKIEELMKKASVLYRDGKISEAQALYAEISALNKQMKKTDTKVLTKVA